MNGDEFTSPPEKTPETQPAFAGGPPQPPPRPPKLTARDLLEPGEPGKRIFVPAHIEIRDLAQLLRVKPFKVVAKVLRLGIFKNADDLIDFAAAATIARQYGFIAEKLL